MLQLILTYLFKPIERICTFTGTLTVQSVAQAYSLSLSKSLSQMFIKIMLTMLQIHVTYSDIAVYIHVHG